MKLFKSLRGQLTVAILTVLTLGIGLLFVIAGNQMAQMTMDSFTHEQQVMALVMANTSTSPDAVGNAQAQALLTAWAMQRHQWTDDFPADTQITLFNPDGTQMATSGTATTSLRPSDLNAVLSGSMISAISAGRLYTVAPMMHDGRILVGILQIDSSLDSVNARLLSRWLVLLGAAGAALLLAFIVALWLSRQLTRPLSELRQVAQQMAEGELDSRVEIDNAVEELESLGSVFNHMARRIEMMMQEQRDFVANASHELRSPLAAIKLRAEALAYQTVNGDRARQYAGEINEEVTQLAQLVNDLLQLSRAESGVFTPPDQPISIADELYACIRAVQPRLTVKHQLFSPTISDDIPGLYIHSNDLRIMVGNLLDNAIKYTPDGGEITLAAAWKSKALDITIADTGEGIPSADLPRISERFFRVDRAHSRNIPGVGLGLALVAAVIHQYKGTIRIESAGIPGQGTRVHLRIPARAQDQPEAALVMGNLA